MSHSEFYRGAEAAARALHALPPPGDPGAAAAAVHAAAEPLFATTTDAGRHACRRGCAHCCRFPVGVTFAEAVRLADAIRGSPLAARFAAAAAATAADAWSTLAGQPCPLLVDEACAAHAARPLPCRALASRDAAACAQALAGPGDVPTDGEAFWRGLGAAATLGAAPWGVHAPTADTPLPTGSRELRAAVAAVLAAGDDLRQAAAAFTQARPAGSD